MCSANSTEPFDQSAVHAAAGVGASAGHCVVACLLTAISFARCVLGVRPLELSVAGDVQLFQQRLRLRFGLERKDLVRVDPCDHIRDVIVDSGEPVARACHNYHHIPGPKLVGRRVFDRRGIEAGSVLFADRQQVGRPRLRAHQVRTGQKRRGAVDDLVYLAHLVVLGNRIRRSRTRCGSRS